MSTEPTPGDRGPATAKHGRGDRLPAGASPAYRRSRHEEKPGGHYDPWATVLERLADAAELAGLDPDVHRLLQVPDRVLEVAVPVRMDDGHVEVFLGWRIHHNTARGPAKGGIRFHPDLSMPPRWPRWRPT